MLMTGKINSIFIVLQRQARLHVLCSQTVTYSSTYFFLAMDALHVCSCCLVVDEAQSVSVGGVTSSIIPSFMKIPYVSTKRHYIDTNTRSMSSQTSTNVSKKMQWARIN
eukprot:m.367467 g.367467  ORF g.367467 m.367467 type:complete len:109 (+) comp40834_c0_seq1:135-461(+)